MQLDELLNKFGLSPKESKIYLSSLELGKATGQEIAKKAELPRSTTYSVLESLISKNLIFLIKKRKVKEYSAEDPQKIINISEETAKALKDALPELKLLYNKTAKNRPKIKYYEGLMAIKEMYNSILKIKGLKEYLIFAPENTWLYMDKKWFTDFKKRRASAKIKTRLILLDNPEARQRQQDSGKYFSEVKILPDNFSFDLNAGIYIFRDKIITTEYKKDLISVEIQSRGIADMQRLMFESLWQRLD